MSKKPRSGPKARGKKRVQLSENENPTTVNEDLVVDENIVTDENREVDENRQINENREADEYVPSNNDDTNPVGRKKARLSKNNSKNIVETTIFKIKRSQCNILKYYKNYEMGFSCLPYKTPLKDIIINYCRTFRLYKVEAPFDRRVTFIVWHPTNPRVLSVTSHGGDVLLYNYEQDMNSASFVKGIGAGGSVQSMKFDPLNPIQIYTVSMEGKFLVLNFQTKEAKQFLATNDINRWYVSVDVNSNNNVMVAGDTRGGISILTTQGEEIDTIQIHKRGCKVSHAEFSKREPWLLCTSSTDCSIKLWDIRKLKSDPHTRIATPLKCIMHQKPVNAAYFSLTDGCRLLTTDQCDKVAVYRAPLWDLETLIRQPHRQFQHLTPIKAYWHPLEDIVFVGRYPHDKFPGYQQDELRTIDFFDADTGDLLYQHYQTGFNGILSLNRFNITGDALASSYGQRFLIWKPDFKNLEKSSKIQDKLDRNRGNEKNSKVDSSSDDDDDDTNEVDWAAILKKQAKEKAKERKTSKEKTAKGKVKEK